MAYVTLKDGRHTYAVWDRCRSDDKTGFYLGTYIVCIIIICAWLYAYIIIIIVSRLLFPHSDYVSKLLPPIDGRDEQRRRPPLIVFYTMPLLLLQCPFPGRNHRQTNHIKILYYVNIIRNYMSPYDKFYSFYKCVFAIVYRKELVVPRPAHAL